MNVKMLTWGQVVRVKTVHVRGVSLNLVGERGLFEQFGGRRYAAGVCWFSAGGCDVETC
jgi:hypothetical protein